MTAYFSGLDAEQHSTGPFSPASLAVLEKIDTITGALRAAAERVRGGRVVFCVVSDHGFARAEREVNLLTAFRSAGLLEFDEDNRVASWQATTWQAGASAAVMLNSTNSDPVRAKVLQLLERLAHDPDNGISELLKPERLHSLGGFPQAEFLIGLRPGYRLGSRTTGPLVIAAKAGGMHGYLPEHSEMNASFFIAGAGISAAHSLGEIGMCDIAPTLAGLLEIVLSSADGRSFLLSPRSAGRQNRPNSSTASYKAATF